MKKLYFISLIAVIGLLFSCKRDAPIYPGEKGYVADTPPGTNTSTGTGTGTGTGGTGTGGTGTGTGGTGTGTGGTGTGTGGTGTGTGGTGTGTGGTVTPVANGNGLPLGAVGTLLYKVQGITYTCNTQVSFAIDLQGNAYLTGVADPSQGPWACTINLNFTGNRVGTYLIKSPFTLTDMSGTNGFTELDLVDGKVAIKNINTDGYLGTLQGTFNANMVDDSNKVYNVIGSFNMKQ